MKFISMHKIPDPQTFGDKIYRNIRINLPFNIEVDIFILDTTGIRYGFDLNLRDFIFEINCFPLSLSIWKCRY